MNSWLNISRVQSLYMGARFESSIHSRHPASLQCNAILSVNMQVQQLNPTGRSHQSKWAAISCGEGFFFSKNAIRSGSNFDVSEFLFTSLQMNSQVCAAIRSWIRIGVNSLTEQAIQERRYTLPRHTRPSSLSHTTRSHLLASETLQCDSKQVYADSV